MDGTEREAQVETPAEARSNRLEPLGRIDDNKVADGHAVAESHAPVENAKQIAVQKMQEALAALKSGNANLAKKILSDTLSLPTMK